MGTTERVLWPNSYLPARYRGSEIDCVQGRGTVHSLFARAFNIQLPNGRIIGITSHRNAACCWNIVLDDAIDFTREFTRLGLAPGRPVRLQADHIQIHPGFGIDLNPARRFHGRIPHWQQPARITWWEFGEQCANKFRSNDGPPGLVLLLPWLESAPLTDSLHCLLLQRCQHALLGLQQAARQLDCRQFIQHWDRLIGLGPGLTPSGDDAVVGFLGALHAAPCRTPAQQTFLITLAEQLANRSMATNPIAREYLLAAVYGRFSQPVTQLLRCRQRGHDPSKPLNELLSVGASSGGDLLVGLFFGGACW